MATSKNAQVQELMNQVEALDDTGESLEAKLSAIAAALKAAQAKPVVGDEGSAERIRIASDPALDHICEGCE